MPADPPPATDPAWDAFTRALILERHGRTCPELPAWERAEKRAADRAQQRWLEEREADRTTPLRAAS